MSRTSLPPGLVVLSVLSALLLPCVAPQPACDAMGAIAPCDDGRAPVCRSDNMWRRRAPVGSKNWDVTCGGAAPARRSRLLYMYVPYATLAGLFVLIGYGAARVQRARGRP